MAVLELSAGKQAAAERRHNSWLRRQAIQIAAQLPEKREDALAVLAYAKTLTEDFLGED